MWHGRVGHPDVGVDDQADSGVLPAERAPERILEWLEEERADTIGQKRIRQREDERFGVGVDIEDPSWTEPRTNAGWSHCLVDGVYD